MEGHSSLCSPFVLLLVSDGNTVQPPSRGHFGASYFVPCSEAVLFSEVEMYVTPYRSTLLEIWRVSFEERLPLSGGSFIRGSVPLYSVLLMYTVEKNCVSNLSIHLLILLLGYGTTAPVTFYGRLLVIILALIGIPITLAFLKYFGSMFKRLIGWLTIRNCCKENALSVTIELVIFIVIGLVFLIIIPTVILNQIENWSIFESLYYCLVTLTTVGFGDFVPGNITDDSLNDLYRCCVGCWIFIGLAYLFIIIELIQSFMEQMVTTCGKTCCSKNKPAKV